MNVKLAGVVILYHPDTDVWHNIQSYISSVEKLYVLDNTEQPDSSVVNQLKEDPKIQYIAFYENRGIAYALNYALTKAQSDGYTFLLTMDQDSSFIKATMDVYLRIIKKNQSDFIFKDVIMYAVTYTGLREAECWSGFKYVLTAITSGSVLNIDLAKKIGAFDENLFIDEVDDEFCYRSNKFGYKILLCCDIKLTHHLGNPKRYNFFGYKFTVLNHGPIRKYYIVRNRLYVSAQYPEIKRYYILSIFKMFIKVMLFENNKLMKIKYMFKGIKDYKMKNLGKYKVI